MKTILQCYRRSLTEALLVLVAAVNAQGQYTYTTLSAPGASETFAYGIYGNNIVGEDYTGSGNYGFLYNAVSGTYTTLSVPGAVQTAAYGISGNNIVGWYNPGGPNTEGFLYNTISQTYTTLNVPGALMTRANGIDGDNITLWSTSGAFLYNMVSQSYTMIEVAGANGTEAMGVSGNNVVGLYLIPYMHQGIQAYTYQGFEYNTVSQVYRTLSVPGSVLTVAAGIDGNNIVGWYGSGAFLYDGSSYTLLNAPPGSVAGQFVAYGISGNNIVGYYEPVGNGYQGYLATPIPEPSGMGLLALGSVVIVIYGGRRSREKVSPKSSPNEH